MTRKINLGDPIIDQFPVYDPSDGYTRVSGETAFTSTVWRDGLEQAVGVAITEPDANGEYRFAFTPTAVGFWKYEVLIDLNKERRKGEAEVTQENAEIKASMADDGTTAAFGVWVQIDGQRVTDFDSIAAVVRDEAGTLIKDLGVETSDTADGVFAFSCPVTDLVYDTPLILIVAAMRSGIVWNHNEGFVVVR